MLQKTDKSVVERKNDFDNFQKISQKYISLKQSLIANDKVEIDLMKIIKLVNIKNIKIEKTNNIIKVKIDNGSLQTIDRFLNKILNDKFIIRKLNINTNNLDLELGLK
jgi:hypothetical protein